MKILSNPWFVGLLGLGAVVVVVFNTFHPHGPQMPVPATGGSRFATVAINSPPPMPGSAESSPASTVTPAEPIDLDYVRSHISDWLTVTQRDPFFLIKLAPVVATNAPVREINRLKLQAIWRQDGVSMIAIDNQVYRVGDEIGGRRVQRIDHDGVFLEYNGKKEFVVFENPLNAPATNTP